MIPLTNRSSATTQKLQAFLGGAAATTNPTVTVGSYIVPPQSKTVSGPSGSIAGDPSEYRSAPQFTVLAGATETDIADAPPEGSVKDINYISIYNADTASVTVTVCVDDNATNRILIKATLATLETLYYEDKQGWYATDANGNRKVATTAVNSSAILGTTTNDNAAAGRIGEYIESEVLAGAAVSVSTATATNVTSISLTAGDWNVWGNIGTTAAGGAILTNWGGWISATSATLPTAPNKGAEIFTPLTYTVDTAAVYPVGMRRISIASTTTIYLSVYLVFAAGTATAYGYIGARRAR